MQYKFCSNCGAPLAQHKPFSAQECDRCGAWHFHNSKPCAGALVVSQAQVLLARRGVEPFKGFWDIPGGFLEAGEEPETGVKRELREETGLEIQLIDLLGLYTDTNGAGNYYTLNIYYLAEAPNGTPQATDDVAELRWFPLDQLPDAFAFEHQYRLMEDLKQWHSRK